MNVLSEIIAKKRERVAGTKERVSFGEVRRVSKPHALRAALRADGINIIAEFKRRSPSKGVIRADANLTKIVKSYETGGAAGISVLTEEDYFDGSLDDLRTVKTTVDLPVLRKDFVFDEYQVYESAAAGADAILLIVAALDDETLTRLRRVAEDELGMDALVEVHTSEEMKRAVSSGATLIGVNNRDLRTFEVSLNTSLSLAREAPADALLISESGLRGPDDLQRLREAGYHGFLIGETLMRADSPEDTLRNFVGAALRGRPVAEMTFVKICGITNLNDALAAVAAGADALGFNFYKPSSRYITPQAAREIIEQLPGSVLTVGVFVNEEDVMSIAKDATIKAVQLHGDESPDYCRELSANTQVIKTLAVSDSFNPKLAEAYQVDAIMLDTRDNRLRGGTGRVFDWSIAQQVRQIVPKLYLAGGLSPENVEEAINTVRPYAVDACSSLEDRPGTKNHGRMRAFVDTVRSVNP